MEFRKEKNTWYLTAIGLQPLPMVRPEKGSSECENRIVGPDRWVQFSSVQFSPSGVSDTLWAYGLQHVRLPCPSTPRACSNSSSSSWWCHPTILSSVIPFFSCLQSCPASGSFSMRQYFQSGGQNIGVSASASVLPMNIQDWFPLGWTGWISLQSKGLSRVFSKSQFKSISSLVLSFHHGPTLTSIHDYWKNHSLD